MAMAIFFIGTARYGHPFNEYIFKAEYTGYLSSDSNIFRQIAVGITNIGNGITGQQFITQRYWVSYNEAVVKQEAHIVGLKTDITEPMYGSSTPVLLDIMNYGTIVIMVMICLCCISILTEYDYGIRILFPLTIIAFTPIFVGFITFLMPHKTTVEQNGVCVKLVLIERSFG